MNFHLEKFVADAKIIAEVNGIDWSYPVGEDGIATNGLAWNLTLISKASPPPRIWLNDLGTDAVTVSILNAEDNAGPVRKYEKRVLPPAWQDLIKACVIDQILVRKNSPSNAVNNIARPLRVLATCSQQAHPADLTHEDINHAIAVARKVQKSGKLADLISGVTRHVLDSNHLTDRGPLFPLIVRDQRAAKRTAAFTKGVTDLRNELEERKRAERLPERRAFWELVRIVFTESPRSFLDLIRFAIIKVIILTGMREGEAVLVPADWKRVTEYLDQASESADQSGGISREVSMRYFGEKQRIKGEDGLVLYETSMNFHLQFERIIEATLDDVKRLTEPLRQTLRAQIRSGRLLPQFSPTDLVHATDLYTILEWTPKLRQANKTHFPTNGEWSYGSESTEVHAGV